MLSSEKNVEMLRGFGLTGNQAKVYLASAGLGLASAGQISKVAKVRREDVYRVVPKLEGMGLVEKLLGKPIKIRATPVEEALSILIENEEAKARERVSMLKAKTKTFLADYACAPRLEVEEKTGFTLLSEREGIKGKMLAMLKMAKKEIVVTCSERKLMQFVHVFDEQIKKAVKKGVKIRIVSETPEDTRRLPVFIEEHILSGTSISLKYTYLPSSHYMIIDFAETLISTATEGNMGDNPYLWTANDNLVNVFQKDFENLWHNAVRWHVIEEPTVPDEVTSFMEQLRPTNHVILVYDSQEAKHNILFNYLKVGFARGEAGVYVAGDEQPNQIREAMKRFGIEVEEHERLGSLQIFKYEDIYIVDGKFEMATTMNRWKNIHSKVKKRGFNGLRVTGEMACFFKHNLAQDLLEYEKALHRVLDIPMIAICAYNADILNKIDDPVNMYAELARAHSTVLFTGIDNKLGRMEIRRA